MCTFTVITVCRNAENVIEETILSVLNQTCTDYEYLIQDGLSQDRTLQIAESYAPAFAEKGIPLRIVSCKDGGIYDAMNRAIARAEGEWLNFMNAGDRFSKPTVLEKVAASGLLEDADVVYGDRICEWENLYCCQKAKPLQDIRTALPFCHQSAFTKRELFVPDGYDTKYKLVSDFAFYLQQYRDGKRFVYFPDAVSIYAVGGVSSDWKKNYRERLQVLEDMPDRDQEAIDQLRNVLQTKIRTEKLHRIVGILIPASWKQKRLARQRRQAGWQTKADFFAE